MLAFPSTLPDSSHMSAYVNLPAFAFNSMKLVDRLLKCGSTDKKPDINHVLFFKCSIHLAQYTSIIRITVEPFIQNTQDVLPVFSLHLCHEDSLRSLTLKGSLLLRLAGRELSFRSRPINRSLRCPSRVWNREVHIVGSWPLTPIFSLPGESFLSTPYPPPSLPTAP